MFQKINDYFSSRKNSKLINEISDKYLKQVNSLEEKITKLSQGELIDKINLLKDNYSKKRNLTKFLKAKLTSAKKVLGELRGVGTRMVDRIKPLHRQGFFMPRSQPSVRAFTEYPQLAWQRVDEQTFRRWRWSASTTLLFGEPVVSPADWLWTIWPLKRRPAISSGL